MTARSMPNEQPERLADLLAKFLRDSGIGGRIQQSSAIADWPLLVGPEIAAVTQPLSISEDGTLFVAVKSHAWMSELTMMERDLLDSINRTTGERPLHKLRWTLMR
jgi:predicted nucleic acid-binding Zn ribbon protein